MIATGLQLILEENVSYKNLDWILSVSTFSSSHAGYTPSFCVQDQPVPYDCSGRKVNNYIYTDVWPDLDEIGFVFFFLLHIFYFMWFIRFRDKICWNTEFSFDRKYFAFYFTLLTQVPQGLHILFTQVKRCSLLMLTRTKKMPDIMIMILSNTNLTITMKIKIIIAVFWRLKKKKNLQGKIWAATSNYLQHSRYLLFSLFIQNISLFLICLNPPTNSS